MKDNLTSSDEYQELKGAATGVIKGVGQTADTLLKLAPGNVGGQVGLSEVTGRNIDLTPHGTAENVGAGIETVAEFMMGDEALKGLSFAERLSKISPVLKGIEKSPRLLKAVLSSINEAAPTAVRQGVTGAAQATLHGATPGEAVETGLVTGGIGGATDIATTALGKGWEALRPTTEAIAGEDIPVMSKAGAKTGAPSAEMEAEQQAASQRILRSSAQRATAGALDQVNQTRYAVSPLTYADRALPAPIEAPSAQYLDLTRQAQEAAQNYHEAVTSTAVPINPKTGQPLTLEEETAQLNNLRSIAARLSDEAAKHAPAGGPTTFTVDTDLPRRPQAAPLKPGAAGPEVPDKFARTPGKMALEPGVVEDESGKYISAPIPVRKLAAYSGANAGEPLIAIKGGEPIHARLAPGDDATLHTVQGNDLVNAARLRGDSDVRVTMPKNEYLRFMQPAQERTTPARFPYFQYLNSARPGVEPIEAGLTGPGTMTISDPNPAIAAAKGQAQLSRMNELIRSDTFDTFSPEEKEHVIGQRDSLKQQLDLHFSAQAAQPNFAPINHRAVAAMVDNMGEASDQVDAAVKPVYQKLDELSNGRFGILREQQKRAIANRYNAPTEEAYGKAQTSLAEATRGINDIFDQNRANIRPEEYTSAQQAYTTARRMEEIHQAIEGSFNRSAPADIAAKMGQPRTVAGNKLTDNLNRLIHKGAPDEDARRLQIEGIIGKDGLENMYRVGDLLRKPETAAPTDDYVRGITKYLMKRAVYAGATHLAGLPWWAAAGAAGTEDAAKWVMRQVATHEAPGRLLDYAVRNKVADNIAIPLIAASLGAVPMQQNDRESYQEIPTQ
jgi:hypothetical protein